MDRSILRPGASWLRWIFAGALLVAGIGTLIAFGGGSIASAASPPSVSITPGPLGGKFGDGQVVRVSVGPNSLFAPHSRVVILQCADPGGDVSHLPLSLVGCDENTVQGDTTLVQSDGSFVEPSYSLYALPSKVLGEQSNWQPICNPTNDCVLFVGQDQNEFSKPKLFSRPFLMSSAAAPATPNPAVATPSPAAATPSSAAAAPAAPVVSAQVSLSPGTLAYTGLADWLAPVAGLGLVIVLLAQLTGFIAKRRGS
jgi:hypothetical protein